MRLEKLVTVVVVFLVLSGGQTIFMVNQTNAYCCNLANPMPGCVKWFSIPISGKAKLQKKDDSGDYTVFFQDNQGHFLHAKPSPLVLKLFENENITEVQGIGIVAWENDELVLAAFALSNPEHHGTTTYSLKTVSPNKAIQNYSKFLEKISQSANSGYKKKISRASMTITK